MRHGGALERPGKKIVGDVKKTFQFSSLRHNLDTDFHIGALSLSISLRVVKRDKNDISSVIAQQNLVWQCFGVFET